MGKSNGGINMNQNDVQDKIQLIDSLVRESSIKNIDKIHNGKELNITSQIGFKIVNIEEKEKNFVGQISLINDLLLKIQEKEVSTIHVRMDGLFTGSKEMERREFEEMLKIKGATILSHFMRAYIHTITGLSGMPNINTPMIDFKKFFEKTEKE